MAQAREIADLQQSTKQRIVGTVVLLALALIFLPIIFDGQGSYQTPLSSRIPEPPQVAVLPEPMQTRPVIIADSFPEPDEPEETAPTIDDALISAIEPATPTDDNSPEDPGPEQTSEPEVEVTVSEPDFTRDPLSLGPDGLPQGWSVRLGSFSDSANADNLLARLQDAGYRAYTRSIASDQGNLTGVFVGPWLDRARVESYQQELQARFQLAGMVVRYRIED